MVKLVTSIKQKQYSWKSLNRESLDKVPPHNLEAEWSVLGAILLDNEALHKALEIFNPDDFYRNSHSMIFNAMLTLQDKGEVIDLLTLRDELERQDKFDEVGGPSYIAALVDHAVTAANIEYHAKIVHEKAITRNLMNASIEVATRCLEDKEEASDLLADAEQKIFAISEGKVKRSFIPLNVIVKESFEHIEECAELKSLVTGVPTGFTEIDRLTAGLQPSDLILIAGRPAMGKSALGINIAQYVSIEKNIPSAIFSLEMSKEQLGVRLLCAQAKLDSYNVRIGKLNDEDWIRLANASEVLAKAPIYIDDTPAISILEMKAKAKRLKIERDLGMVIVDYLQLMESRFKHENRQQEITEISRSLKALAKELDVPVVALSQLSRACEQRQNKCPQLSDLRESGSLEQDADVVMFIYRPEIYGIADTEGLAEIIIGKQRNGPVGSVNLAFIKEYTRFENLETRHTLVEQPLDA